MAVSISDSTPENTATKGPGNLIWANTRIASVLIAVGLFPLVYCHIAGMLMRPHYQFIALLPLAIWLLAISRPRDESDIDQTAPQAGSRDVIVSLGLLLVSVVGLSLAVWAWSPWIAAVSGMFAAISVLLRWGGPAKLRSMSPTLIFCLVLIPLPFGLDEDLVVALRSVTTRLSSSVLDQLGILHQAYANVIHLPGKALFVADACSGIQSLYVLLAMALFLATLMRRGISHSVLLLASTFGLVIVENVTRIVSVAWATGHAMDWSRGTNHEILGVVLFLFSAILVISTDQFLLFLLPESWLDLFRSALRLAPRSRRGFSSSHSEISPPELWLTKAWFVTACVFPLLGLLQLPQVVGNAPPVASLFTEDLELEAFGEDAMPEQWQGFRRLGYEQIDRVPGDPFGQSSQRWLYEKDGMKIGLSIDYPYSGLKDLCECYTMIGWTVEEQTRLEDSDLPPITVNAPPQAPCARAKIQRELFGEGLLVFSSLDREGDSEVMLKDVRRGDANKRIADRWSFAAGETQEPVIQSGRGPYTQLHVLAQSFEPITRESERKVIEFFLRSRELLTPQIIDSLKNSAGNSDGDGSATGESKNNPMTNEAAQ